MLFVFLARVETAHYHITLFLPIVHTLNVMVALKPAAIRESVLPALYGCRFNFHPPWFFANCSRGVIGSSR
jgi:hypothetical protein